MAHPMHPHQGARFELLRQASDLDAGTAQYKAKLYVADACFTCLIGVDVEQKTPNWGPLEVTHTDGGDMEAAPSLPPWVEKHANALLRQCVSQARKGSWPRRIRRWRDAPSTD